MSTFVSLLQKIRKTKEDKWLLEPEDVFSLCCAALEGTYLIKLGGGYVPADMEERIDAGYAQACNEQHKKICEIKRLLKETLL